MGIRYKFLEVTPVTDDKLEEAVNAWARYGWTLDKIQFILRDNSYRPAMAFVTMIKSDLRPPEEEPVEAPAAASEPGPEPEALEAAPYLEPKPLDVSDLLAKAAASPSEIIHED